MCLRVEKVCPSQAQTHFQTHQTHMKTHFVVALLVALLMLRKTGKPLQESGVCVVRIAENPLLIGRRGTLSLGYYDPERA